MKLETFFKRSPMPVPAAELFAWHARTGAFERLSAPWSPATVESREGGLEVGSRLVLSTKVGPVTRRWVAEHTAFEAGQMFRDEQKEGPFARWVHTHRFVPQPDGTSVLEDEVEYALPLGAVGALFGGSTARATLERLFAYRHAVTRMDLERHARFAGRPRLTVAITGASGLLGSALTPFLTAAGHSVRAVRRSGAGLDEAALRGADAVIHLAGAPIAEGRWTAKRKRELVTSRVDLTKQLVDALKSSPPRVLLSGSATGIYGDRGDEELSEASPIGQRSEQGAGFLAGLTSDWEAAGREANGSRVALLRTGVVLTAQGGALAKLVPAFKAGAGGPVGPGTQWLSWISLEDELGALLHLLFEESLSGPVNLVAPVPLTSADFAKVLGRVLHRPAITPLPAIALRAMYGELAQGTLLAGQRVRPDALERSGFKFVHRTLEEALRFTLGR